MNTKIRTKKLAGWIVTGLALAQWMIFLPGTGMAGSPKNAFDSDAGSVLSVSTDMSKILLVLENRIEDRRSLEKTRGKLLTLDDRQIRLIASLSDRVHTEGNTTGSELAFFLMTALITLI
jgi:hypothetical protein